MGGLDFLKKVDIFKGFNKEQLKAVNKEAHKKEYFYGDRLFAEGEDADRIWLVEEGQVDLRFDLPGRQTSEENNVFSIASGQTLGWSGFVPPFKYALSAYSATKPCKILQIAKDYLLECFEKDPRMGLMFMTNLATITSMHFDQLQKSASVSPAAKVKITVHMATCGIAAGAREVMNALVEEISRSNRKDIEVASSGCIGHCKNEPNITVEIGGGEPVIYQQMTPDKMRQVFKRHIMMGEIQEDYRLA
ncbi:MAG: cyclic nucleotide-binding domain-containing protein [Desulfobacterales bacterium]|jgi:NADP-reducing hydrogenase subunit HndB